MDSNLTIQKVLTLYTGHLTESTFEKLQSDAMADTNDNLPVLSAYCYTYGFLAHIIGEPNDETPDDLKQCLKLAKDNDCSIILFDNMAQPTNHLTVYFEP